MTKLRTKASNFGTVVSLSLSGWPVHPLRLKVLKTKKTST